MSETINPALRPGYYAAPAPVIEDWARFIEFRPSLYFKPKSLDELKGFLGGIAAGALPETRVRVLGGLHSCARICESDTVIDVSLLPQTLDFDDDDSAVTATANWHLHDFLYELAKRGKTLTATGGTDQQTLAGLISTNTAPATPKHTLYSLVEWIEYLTVDEDGKTIVEKRATRGEPEFPAVIGSLGAIGVLTRVRFNLVDQMYFETIQKITSLDEMLGDIEATSQKYDFWRIDWIPDSQRGLIWTARKIPPEQADPDGDYRPDGSEGALKTIFQFFDKIAGKKHGPFLNHTMELVYDGLSLVYGTTRANGPLRNMLPVDRRAPLHVAMAEWSFAPADLRRVIEACTEYFKANRWPNLPIEIELTKTDNHLMSPWNWEGLDYIVKFNFMYLTDICDDAEKEQIYPHLRGLWNHFRQQGIRFKAHWGKINFLDYEFVKANYHLDQFEPLIRPLFLNPYLTERLVRPA